MAALVAQEPDPVPEGYTTTKIEYQASMFTHRSSVPNQQATVDTFVARQMQPKSRTPTIFEVLHPDRPHSPFWDYDEYRPLDSIPGEAELEQIHATNIQEITTFMVLNDPTSTFDASHHLQAAQRHREVRHGGTTVFKISFRYYAHGYSVLLPRLKAAMEDAQRGPEGLFSSKGWDLAVYPTNGTRLLNSVLSCKGKDGDFALLMPMRQPDGTLPQLHRYLVGYTSKADVELFACVEPPALTNPYGAFAVPATPMAATSPTPPAPPSSVLSPAPTAAFGTPLQTAPAAHLEKYSQNQLQLRVAVSLNDCFGTADGYSMLHFRGSEMYFKTNLGGRTCMDGVRHSSNNFVVSLCPSGDIKFFCFSEKCKAHRHKVIGSWQPNPPNPTDAFDFSRVTPAQLRNFSTALMCRAAKAPEQLPKGDPRLEAYEAFVVWYYNKHVVFVETSQGEVVQVRVRQHVQDTVYVW